MFAVLFDLEYTAWEGSMAERWLAPGQFRELVQIGAVKIDAETLVPLAELDVLVRPRINGMLSDYFENLTGISNAALARRGIDFADGYCRFVDFAGGAPIFSFGRDDRVLMHNIDIYGLQDTPPLPRHHNIAEWLRTNGIDTKGWHACDVAKLCGANFAGRAHDALSDAHSLAAGARALIGRGASNIFVDVQG